MKTRKIYLDKVAVGQTFYYLGVKYTKLDSSNINSDGKTYYLGEDNKLHSTIWSTREVHIEIPLVNIKKIKIGSEFSVPSKGNKVFTRVKVCNSTKIYGMRGNDITLINDTTAYIMD